MYHTEKRIKRGKNKESKKVNRIKNRDKKKNYEVKSWGKPASRMLEQSKKETFKNAQPPSWMANKLQFITRHFRFLYLHNKMLMAQQ
jgi:hypothetical protein